MSSPFLSQEIDNVVTKDPRWDLIQRIVSSEYFRTSARLCDFLLYVGECSIRGLPKNATEQQIGIHVFQRSPGYNASEDSIVRSHARLLRQKLAKYFLEEGAHEEIVIEIPKGHYLPVFRAAKPHYADPDPFGTSELRTASLNAPASLIAPNSAPRAFRRIWLTVTGCLLLTILASVAWWVRPKQRQVESGMETLWGPFLSGGPTLVIYSTPLFEEDPKGELHIVPLEPDVASQRPLKTYTAQYTGTSALIAVHLLTQLFDSNHSTFSLKGSRMVTWDDARQADLIFIGSRQQNLALTMLPPMSDFTLSDDTGTMGFINNHPRPGEPHLYSRPKKVFDKDYAVLALHPGLQQGKWIMVFSGLSSLGTEAAAEYVCSSADVAALLRAASFKDGEIRPFEALLETSIVGGVPMEAKLVTIRNH